MRKKIFISVLLLVMWVSICGMLSYAENVGDVIGHIYSTDIIAYIDGMPIKSYNIGGRTVIQIEDLRDYGFDVDWSEDSRTLTSKILEKPQIAPQTVIERQEPGRNLGNIYFTDIEVFINGLECIDTYNIGGITCIAIEDLGVSGNIPNFSKYGMRCIYNDDERVIKLDTMRKGDILSTEYGDATIVNINSNYHKGSYFYTDNKSVNPDLENYPIFDVYLAEKSSWDKYLNISNLPAESHLSAEMNNGTYSITSSSENDIYYKSFGSSNGSSHNDSVVILLSIPATINGNRINSFESNCLMQLNGTDDNYDDLYMSMNFLNKYVHRDFVEQ